MTGNVKRSRGSVTLHDAVLLLFCHITNLKPETLRNWPEVAQLLMADPGFGSSRVLPERGPFHNSASMPELNESFSVVTDSLQPASPMNVTLPPSKLNRTLSPAWDALPPSLLLSASDPSFKARG